MKTNELLKDYGNGDSVNTAINEYSEKFEPHNPAGKRLEQAPQLSQEYYGLVTDFYLHGWGPMFHFGVRKKGETHKNSQLRYEMYLADKLQMKEGEKCLDIGCGVCGPMINIAKHSGAYIAGINNSTYQLQKGEKFIKQAGVEKNCSFIECNWMAIPFPSSSFDKAYAIEATCHAAENRKELFTEIYRLLKPGGLFACYDWVMTDKFNPANPEHQDAKQKIEIGDGISNLNSIADVTDALKDAGFEIVECYDRALECDKETPWYLPLKGSKFSLTYLRTGPLGRFLMKNFLTLSEAIGLVPKGSSKVHQVLELAAEGLVSGGEQGIFTPMLFFLARKK